MSKICVTTNSVVSTLLGWTKMNMRLKMYPPIAVNSDEVWDRIKECEKLAATKRAAAS